ncbi:DgyrCDS9742 [Dimorphilus gyrociliatus]|uniref:DgyrCDS9742 n=1 Tax=Dimorphilus gyrociliatus TaxID=2664684 RepID=A0A7I8VY95_9ANNE|nr:DgyrCDS9742 [Dimorphilus gyrociliatus]
MNVIILAAGYGTRLQNDIINDKTGKYSNLLDVPKPLLPIKNDQPLLSLWMEIINEVDIINKVYIVVSIEYCEEKHDKKFQRNTNEKFYCCSSFKINRKYEDQFRLWAKDHPNIILVVENSCSNEDRSGAVKCIQLALDSMEELTDVNVLAGDTLFMKDFSLSKAICLFKNISGNKDISLISYYNCSDNDVSKRGILEVDDSGHVLQFLEKPKPSVTTSRKACPCFYLLHRNHTKLIQKFLHEKRVRAVFCSFLEESTAI